MIVLARRAIAAYESSPRWLRISAALGWAATIWYASGRPARGTAVSLVWQVLHNGAHVVAFGVLAMLVYLVITAPVASRALWAWTVAACYGVVDELHQTAVAGRDASLWDVTSDACGAAMFTAAAVWITRRSRAALWVAAGFVPCAACSVALACL